MDVCLCVHVQVQEQLDGSREEVRSLETQLQKKETALVTTQSKLEQFTSDLQNKVCGTLLYTYKQSSQTH